MRSHFRSGAALCALAASLTLGLAFGASGAQAASGDTLKAVKARGELVCGVTQGLDGFSLQDSEGKYAGLDVDYCRAIAAAVFGDASKVRFRPLSAKERFEALKSGEVDVLARVTTWSLSRDTQLGVIFAATNFYDGQAMLVPTSLGVASAADLDGARLCTNTGTTTELNITDYFRSNGLSFELIAFEKSDEAASAYEAGRCDVYTSDASGLAAKRLTFAEPAAHELLPEIISKEPLAPAVRQGDEQWLNVARWTHFAQLNAEELGLNSGNVDQILEEQRALAAESKGSQEVQRFLGLGDDYGAAFGLSKDWAYQIVKQVGNYGEIFDAAHGPGGALGLPRGLNALWTQGGLQYGIPIR